MNYDIMFQEWEILVAGITLLLSTIFLIAYVTCTIGDIR